MAALHYAAHTHANTPEGLRAKTRIIGVSFRTFAADVDPLFDRWQAAIPRSARQAYREFALVVVMLLANQLSQLARDRAT